MRLLGSLSFRLALVYAALFAASVLLLGGLYYWTAIAAPMREVRSGLAEEAEAFTALRDARGDEALARLLERRAGAPTPRMAYHALLRSDGSVVTANLPSWPHARTERWLRIEADVAREGDEDEYEALALDLALADGARLIIGRDIEDLDEIEEALKETLQWLLPALLLLTVAGGALMSRAIGRRIDAMASTARRVIEGNLGERIPLRGTGDDFERLAGTFNHMLDRIEAAMEAVRRVSDSVAHELRTPLTRLQASLAELEADPQAGEARLREAIEEAERLQAIFAAVLRISRIEASRSRVGFAPLDLSALVEDAVDYYRPAAEDRGQVLTTRIAPDLEVEGDRDLLFQAVSNLIDNAIKYAPEGGRIAIRLERTGGDVAFTVEDDGPGIAEDLRSRVTERFFRAPGTETVPGLGLGLALVSAVATQHGARLTLDDAAPGLRAELRLPA